MALLIVTKEEFFAKVEIGSAPDSCWTWQGARNPKGYGVVFRPKCKGWGPQAHRVAWAMEHGEPGSLHVLHSCDNPPCVRPSHLFLGTNKDNAVDRGKKGRTARGSANGQAVLSEPDVIEIRASPSVPGRALARRYGVSEQTVCDIRKGRIWRHLLTLSEQGQILGRTAGRLGGRRTLLGICPT